MRQSKTDALIERAKHFIETDLWIVDVSRENSWVRAGYGLLRIVVMTIREFLEQKASVRASALTYYTLLSLVPVIALAFAIAKGFGLESLLADHMRDGLNNAAVADYLINFAASALDNAKGGVIAGVGAAMLIYSVFKLLNNIEAAFNDMWCVKRSRGVIRKVADYLCIMLFTPIMLLTASSATLLVKSSIRSTLTGELTPLQDVALSALPYLILWTAFTLLYLVMPNTKVKVAPALVAGVVTGTAFQIVQWVYITFQIGVNSAGAVYGSFAFLPLLLTWLQITWTIVLAGCKIAFSIQNVTDYSQEHSVTEISHDAERKVAVIVMRRIVKAFKTGVERPTGLDIANELGLAKPLFFNLAERLKRAGLIAELENDDDKKDERTFIPAIDVSEITAARVCQAIDALGDDSAVGVTRDKKYDAIMTEVDSLYTPDNKAGNPLANT